MDELTLGSLFDGSGGFPLGGMLAGIHPVWSAEVEPFAVRVVTKRMPFVKHYGDVSTLNGGEIEPVDIITFGSPCQDMSVAGKRAGLGGSQSCLFYEAIRIVKEMRCATNGKYPTFIVWENVPGAFSSNGGEDFRAVLEAVCSVKWPGVSLPRPERWTTAGEILADGFSLAWRTLDAQYWGVPQRRKRIYLVADFADRRAGKILFESEGLSGYSAESFRAWQRAAGGAASGAGAAGGNDYLAFHINQREETIDLHGVSGALMATQNTQMQTFIASPISGVVQSAGFCTEHSAKSRSIGYEEERSPTLRTGTVPAAVALYENHAQDSRYTGPLDTSPTVSATYGTGGNNQPFVVGDTPKTLKIRCGCAGGGKGPLIQEDKSATLGCSNDQTVFVPQAYGISAHLSKAMLSGNPHSGIYEADTSRTLDAKCGLPSCNQGGIAVVERSDEDTIYALTTGAFLQTAEDQAPTLLARDYKDLTAVAYGIGRDAFNQGQNAQFTPSVSEELQPPLVAKGPGAVKCGYTVRRLTPIECARLQGFPDWWCDGLGTENPTDEELAFWAEVWETHRRVVSHASKPKTERQIRKWLLNPYTDSAAYRLWGNGVALRLFRPGWHCVLRTISFVIIWFIFSQKTLAIYPIQSEYVTTKSKGGLHMEVRYNVTGARRKELAQVISNITGARAEYQYTPTFAYQIDFFTLTRDGTLAFSDRSDTEIVEEVLEGIAKAGFECEANEAAESAEDFPVEQESEESEKSAQDANVGLTVAIPRDKVAVENLNRLLDAKGNLIRKALGIDALPVEVGEDAVSFPWFSDQPDADTAKAYTHFIAALCEMSVNQKRVTAKEKTVENEKYAFRCFLLRLGFIGAEYKEERKVLLRNLAGSSAFKSGSRREAADDVVSQ